MHTYICLIIAFFFSSMLFKGTFEKSIKEIYDLKSRVQFDALNIGGLSVESHWHSQWNTGCDSSEQPWDVGCARADCLPCVLFSLRIFSSQMDPTQDLWARNKVF